MSDDNQRQEKSASETAEELVSVAQEYFSHEFPNSGHGCPTAEEIPRQIESGQLPDDALREHLLACSTCFVTYRERLHTSRDMQPVVGSLRRRIPELRNPWVRVLVPSLPVLLVVLVAIFYLTPKNPQETVTVANSTGEAVNTNGNANAITTASPSPAQVDSTDQLDRATHVARVDLRNYLAQRGNEMGEEPPPLQLKQNPTTFTITLPNDSPPGTYSVSILDAFGKRIKSRTSYSADGKRLTVILNLDSLQRRNYRLCVARSDEPPNCYPIVITNRGK